MTRTKKVGVIGRYGTRYGVSVRRRIRMLDESSRGRHVCPSCSARRVRRVSKGVWLCKKCGHKFAGGTYTPVVVREERA